MLASSLAAISIGTPLRSTRAWIKAPWMADTRDGKFADSPWSEMDSNFQYRNDIRLLADLYA
jgi:hypothetical protein